MQISSVNVSSNRVDNLHYRPQNWDNILLSFLDSLNSTSASSLSDLKIKNFENLQN